MVGRNTLKLWFSTGAKPLGTQFEAWIDSFWHKDDDIPADKIAGLQAALDDKASTQVVENIATDLRDVKTEIDGMTVVLETTEI